jgi:diaminohydroxyphosphoribosylaminopyrimidine deaminase/5-amino-6-(5-phosphoribosylamino)uracil reductase
VDQLNSEEGLRGAIAQLAQIAPANEILLECGPALAGNALRAGLVDELVLYQAPVILGHSARSLVQMDVSTMTERLNFDLIELRQIGQDQRLTLRPRAQTREHYVYRHHRSDR